MGEQLTDFDYELIGTEPVSRFNEAGTGSVTFWPEQGSAGRMGFGGITLAMRDTPDDVWSPPFQLARSGGSSQHYTREDFGRIADALGMVHDSYPPRPAAA